MSKFGVVSDSGVNSEVEKKWVTTAGAEGSEVSSLGRVGERSGVSAGITAASGVDRVRPGVVKVRSEFILEARSGLGVKVSLGSEVTSCVEAASGMSSGTESEVTSGPEGSGEAVGTGEGAGGAVPAVVVRCSLRSGHGFLREPGGGGKTDGGGQLAPPTPGAHPAPPGRNHQREGAGPCDVVGRQQTLPRPSAPPPRHLLCLQAPPGVLHRGRGNARELRSTAEGRRGRKRGGQ